jgi:LytS/YehU family sensor histidine kinase
MFVYYAEYLFIFPRFYGKNPIKLIFSIISILVIYQLINHSVFYYLVPFLGDRNIFETAPPHLLILTSSFLFFFTSIVAFGASRNKISKLNMTEQNRREKALLIKELGFYKNQFNSHITFNFLNYCYSHVQTNSKEGAKAIELFSEMLGYTFNSSPDEPVSLKKEIEYISNFIDLQKILSNGIRVNFQVQGELNNKYLLPRILINFIENAFKHGDTKSNDFPINIRLEIQENLIKLFVENKKKKKSEVISSTGFGNSNSIKQLELLYNNNYEYSHNDDENFYSCKLFLTNKPMRG